MRFTASFLKSCGALADLPAPALPEVAILGRSNVGKSSLLNALADRHQLAKTSRTPGRTRLLNLFLVNEGALCLVDCPGYGYAKVSRTEREKWGALIEPYLETRPSLRLCVLLVDGMLPAQPLDLDLHDWLRHHRLPTLLVATKWDRLTGNQRPQAKARLQAAFQDTPLPVSAVGGEGMPELRRALLSIAAPAPLPG